MRWLLAFIDRRIEARVRIQMRLREIERAPNKIAVRRFPTVSTER